MNLHLLRSFLTVVETQSYSRAAEALFVSQSAVSKAVRELEHQLDLPLMERGAEGKSPRGVVLTEHGRAVFEHARAIFALERAASEDVRDRVELRQGRLRIGASTTVAAYWLPRTLAAFVRRHPALQLELVVGNTDEISRALIDCRIDVGYVEGEIEDARIAATLWRTEPLRLIAAADDDASGRPKRINPAALAEQTWLLREPGSGTRQAAQAWFDAQGLVPARVIEVGSNEAIARAVAAGAGVALLPETVVADLLAIGRLRTIAAAGGSHAATRPLYRLELVNRPQAPALRAFLALDTDTAQAGRRRSQG